MKVKELSFGTINIDGKDYFKDIVIHKGKIEKRKKKEPKKFSSQFEQRVSNLFPHPIPNQPNGATFFAL